MQVKTFSGDISPETEDELLAKPNVLAVGRGPKRTDGDVLDEEAVVVVVRRKLPKSELADDDLVPETVDVDEETVQTDVVDAGGEFYALAQQYAPDDPVTQQPSEGGMRQPIQRPDRQEFVGEVGPAQTRMDRWRPASGGVSIGHPDVTAGTLGTSPLYTSDDETVFLTNAHVAAPANRSSAGDTILQPGRHDGGTSPDDAIGELLEWSELSEDEINRTDSALVRIEGDLVENDVLGIPDLNGWANARYGEVHVKSGRTTGVTSGELIARDLRAEINYGHPFSEPLEFEGLDVFGAMSSGGDSGSVIGTLRPDGFYGTDLLFAGSPKITLGIPMGTVQDEHGMLEPITAQQGQESAPGGAIGAGPSAGQTQPPRPGGSVGEQLGGSTTGRPIGQETTAAPSQQAAVQGISDPKDHFSGSLDPGQYQLWWSGPWDPRYSVDYYVDPLNPEGRIQSSVHSVKMDSNGRLFYYINVKNIADVATRFRARYVYHWK
ncbi:hypothetical protein [Halosimplex amylolyticum]|uniref:hypothetical protein n=1 Tax=Halosimplex amylolyticum TaxID=3396616 RepID=UPI003F54C8A5